MKFSTIFFFFCDFYNVFKKAKALTFTKYLKLFLLLYEIGDFFFFLKKKKKNKAKEKSSLQKNL
jgi:hypothetical protein